MDKYFKNIRGLIENNLVEEKKQDISKNHHKLKTYYNVGKEIVEAQGGEERAKYGNELIKKYSRKLSKEYGEKYSDRLLRKMRQFYLVFRVEKIWPTLSAKMSWSHFEELLPIKNIDERNYYINSCIDHCFSVRDLKKHIKTDAYGRLEKKDNIKLKYVDDYNGDPDILDMLKKEILITINDSVNKITEKALKKFILEQIEKIMLELGVGFAFMGSEVPIKVDNKILKPDLVFFNVELNGYVILELKINELTIQDIGQIEFYVKYYDCDIKNPHHNATIGITISKKVNPNLITYNEKPNIKHTTYALINESEEK